MTDIPHLLENFAKNLQKQISPIGSALKAITDEPYYEEIENRIPQAKVAVFWDYENFPIPNGINEQLFFESLFLSGRKDRYVIKRVYAKPEIINSKLEIIKMHGFELKEGLLSGKTNEIDHVLMLDCIDYCLKSDESLLVVLMAGDVDYISLVEKLTENGHEVRIVCNDKNKVNRSLQSIIPVIIDRNWISTNISQLQVQLFSLSSIINYLLSFNLNKSENFLDLQNEIIEYYTNNVHQQVASLFNIILENADYNWQYTVSNEIIQKIDLSPTNEGNNPGKLSIQDRKSAIYYQLGYEEEYETWITTWNEYQAVEPDKNTQKQTLLRLYNTNLPHIRNFVQRELINLLLTEQSETKNIHENIFTNNKNFTEFRDKIHLRDQNSKNKFKCKNCNKGFNSDTSLQQHIKDYHKDNRPPFLCPICGKNLTNRPNVENHTSQAHNSNDKPYPYECEICYLRFNTDQGKKNHKQSKHHR